DEDGPDDHRQDGDANVERVQLVLLTLPLRLLATARRRRGRAHRGAAAPLRRPNARWPRRWGGSHPSLSAYASGGVVALCAGSSWTGGAAGGSATAGRLSARGRAGLAHPP